MENKKTLHPVLTAETNRIDQSYEYNTLMSTLKVSVSKHLLDENFTMVWANDFYYRVIRYEKKEYEAKFHNNPQIYYTFHGYQNELAKITDATLTAIKKGENGYSVVTRMPVKGGGHIWVRMAAAFTDEWIEGKQVSYTVITDIDDLVQMRKSQLITYNNIPGFVAKFKIKKDNEFELIEANDQFNSFFGCKSDINPNSIIYKKNMEINREVIAQQLPRLAKAEPVKFLVRMVNKRQETVWMQVRGECVDFLDKCPVYLLIYIDITDLTDLRQMQEKLQEQAEQLKSALKIAENANRAKSDFLSRMSHDIRTPMNAIVGMTEIAADYLDYPDKVRDCLKKIKVSSQHLSGLINDVLDMSKIESGKMTLRNDPILLPEVLESVIAIVQPMIKSREQNFSIRLHDVFHEKFLCDSLRLRQVFINILSNASKFTPPGGSLTVDVEETASADPATALLRFRFKDTGIGIKPEFIAHVFDAFTRERDGRVDTTEGSGLGMAITQKIVELIGGRITVESEWNKGTTFTVDLPLPIDAEAECQYNLNGLKVMVIDDDTTLCKYTAQMLSSCGAVGDWADSGDEAVQRIKQAHIGGKDYDVVIVDWKMPRQDGIATVKKIREEAGRRIPILIVSAYDLAEIEESALQAGADGLLPKPLFRSNLCRSLRRYLLQQDPVNVAYDKYQYDFSGKTILMVEDNELNREIAAELLTRAGAKVVEAGNGEEGYKTFVNSPAGYFNLILMDVQMPIMNGYDAAKAIRRSEKADAADIPILAMTADAFSEDIAAAKDAGMNDHIAKPIDLAEMKSKIAKALA